jgi:hypothetical protein
MPISTINQNGLTNPLTLTLTSPTIAGNGLINQSWTTAGRPASPTTGAQGFNTTLNVPENYNSTNGWVQGGMYLTGSATIASGSPQAYIDIANCFNSTFQNYVVKVQIYNGANTGGGGGQVLCIAYETTGASLSGGLFTGGSFSGNYYWIMNYQQTNLFSNSGTQGGSASTTLYPEIFGSLGSGANAGTVYFMGTLNLYDVYANSIKIGDAQGTMINPTPYLEQSNFVSASAATGRGLRLWIGITDGNSINSYGTVKVYGVL